MCMCFHPSVLLICLSFCSFNYSLLPAILFLFVNFKFYSVFHGMSDSQSAFQFVSQSAFQFVGEAVSGLVGSSLIISLSV